MRSFNSTSTKHWIAPVICLIMFLMLLAIIGCNKERSNSFQFGVVAPFSGQEGASVYGKNIKQAVELALTEINSKGGINGRKMVAIYEDDQLQASMAVSAVQKLISSSQISVIIGPVASSSTIAASTVAESNKIILISPSSTSNKISGLSPWVFRTIAPDNYEAERMAKYALSKGYKRVGIVFVDNAGTKGPAEIFQKVFSSSSGQITAYEVVPQGVTDVRVQISKLVNSKPDAVYLLGYALELGAMIKQFREQDPNTPVLSFQVMEEPKVREIAGKTAEGVIFTTPTIYGDFAMGKQKQFIKSYRALYNEDPGIFAANAYDAVYVIYEAVTKHGEEPDKLRLGIGQIRNFDGASGRFDINEKGDSNQEPRIMKIHNGMIELAE